MSLISSEDAPEPTTTGDHPATPGYAPIISGPAPQEAPTKSTKAIVGTIITAVTTGALAAAQLLPSPFDGYVTGAVAIVGVVCSFFGIYLPANKPK